MYPLLWLLVTIPTTVCSYPSRCWAKMMHFLHDESSITNYCLGRGVTYLIRHFIQINWYITHVKDTDMVTNSAFKWCSDGTKGPKVCQVKNGWYNPYFHTDYTKFWLYLLNGAAEIQTHETRRHFSNRSIFQFWWADENYGLVFVFFAERSGTLCGLLLL